MTRLVFAEVKKGEAAEKVDEKDVPELVEETEETLKIEIVEAEPTPAEPVSEPIEVAQTGPETLPMVPAAKPTEAAQGAESGDDEDDEGDKQLVSIANSVGAALDGLKTGASIEFTHSRDGVLIRIMDNDDFGMFAVGSSEPHPDVVKAMEKIAKVLEEENGEIVIRGHTDARPFKSKRNDNWRLSTARAHMAYFMLVRGGLDENRIVGIEGYADRRLKDVEEPYAPQNRRIEIMLMKGQADVSENCKMYWYFSPEISFALCWPACGCCPSRNGTAACIGSDDFNG